MPPRMPKITEFSRALSCSTLSVSTLYISIEDDDGVIPAAASVVDATGESIIDLA